MLGVIRAFVVDLKEKKKNRAGADGAALWSAAAVHAGGPGGGGEQRQVGVSVHVCACARQRREEALGEGLVGVGGRGIRIALPGSVVARGRRG